MKNEWQRFAFFSLTIIRCSGRVSGRCSPQSPTWKWLAKRANATDAVTLAEQLRPDVVLMDIGMPGMSSFEATRLIRKARPETKVLFLSMYDDEDYLVGVHGTGRQRLHSEGQPVRPACDRHSRSRIAAEAF